MSPYGTLSWFIQLDLNSKETDIASKKQKKNPNKKSSAFLQGNSWTTEWENRH